MRILTVPIVMILATIEIGTATMAFGHDDYTQSPGCESANMTSFWLSGVCHHQLPLKAVATTTFHCLKNRCESGGWVSIPIPKHGVSNAKLTSAPYLQSPRNSNNSTGNSTDGGRCVNYTCQINESSCQEASVFCQPTQTAPMFPWREWCIW
jgi:hypothetical protein